MLASILGIIETACRDRYFWVSVDVGSADHDPRFEAVVGNGVHAINKKHASMCGYTLNNLNGRVTLRASYFSCHTENQNDNHFLFKLNVVLTDDEGKDSKHSISETCMLPVDWSAKEVICEKNYVERSAITEWQIMFLNNENVTSMSISDARRRGYMVDSTPNRVVLRSAYNQPHSTITQDITLRNFAGIFEVLTRDSKTLEIHSRTAKHCLFQTYELTVCSPDGIMTVVATTTKTWPTVPPSSTTLLDRRCKPKSTDETGVMFSFGVTTCGTKLMVGDGYIVYENEIVSDGGTVTDQESAITRESQFRLTVRCFYSLNTVKRVFTARLFEGSGFGTLQTPQISEDQRKTLSALTWPQCLSLTHG